MDGLNFLLSRYRQLFADKQLEFGEILEVINQQAGLKLSTQDLRLKEGILFLQTKPKYKLEIILKKPAILSGLNARGIKVVDLR